MLKKILELFDKKFNVQPIPYKPDEPILAFQKVTKSLESAWHPAHVDAAETLLVNLMHRYNFTQEQRASPLVTGLHALIVKRRAELQQQWCQV